MGTRIIINADDFGLTAGVNRGIADLYREGVLTSATMMANGPAFADAAGIALAHPRLGVGCHVVLVDGVPVSPPTSIPSLMGADGVSFRTSIGSFAAAMASGRIAAADIYREALAQVRKLQDAGIGVTHLDTHKHTHLFPQVCRPLLQAARAARVGAVRNPFEPRWSLHREQGSLLRRLQLTLLGSQKSRFAREVDAGRSEVQTTDGTIGVAITGRLDSSTLRRLLGGVPPGTWELVCHPGYNDEDLQAVRTRLRGQRGTELQALREVVPALRTIAEPPALIHFGDLNRE